MRHDALIGLGALLVGLVLAGSATASAAPLGPRTHDFSPNTANANVPSAIGTPVSTPEIPRPPIPSSLKNLFRAKPHPVPRWRLPTPRPRVPHPGLPRAHFAFDVFTLKRAPTTADARKALRRIYDGDQYEKVSVHAFCWGVDQLADYRDDPGAYFAEHTWRSIFFGFFRSYVEDYFAPRALQVVNGWTNVWAMAQIHPALAYFYFRACYG